MYNKTKSSTQHGLKTPYGLRVPHRYPSKTSSEEDLFDLISELYPTGRAWSLPENSVFKNFHKAINKSFLRFISDAYATIDSTFPDNDNFDENDCLLWENKLGLNTNLSLSVTLRKAIILRKFAYPQNKTLRQNKYYIQEQLQLYGFNVGVYENLVPQTPAEISGQNVGNVQHGGSTQHGGATQHGGSNFDVIANSMFDENYSIGGTENLWASFFIAGPNSLNEFAVIENSRKREFRELVLKLKPAHLVAFTFINYI